MVDWLGKLGRLKDADRTCSIAEVKTAHGARIPSTDCRLNWTVQLINPDNIPFKVPLPRKAEQGDLPQRVEPVPYPLSAADQLSISGRRPLLPPGIRVYAVGDIHGRLDLLEGLLGQVERDMAARPAARPIFIFLGDYIDRGPASKQTIERLVEHAGSYECVFLKGNHEALALRSLTDRIAFDRWMRLGGFETLVSYGVMPGFLGGGPTRSVPEAQATFHAALGSKHMQFFRNLQASCTFGDFFFVHAGVRPGVALSQQAEEDLLWIRGEFLDMQGEFGKIVIHGHTPTKTVEVRTNRVNIDTGAFATGRLTCLVLEESSLSLIDTLTPAS